MKSLENKNYIPYGRQSISQEDIERVCSVLSSEWLTQGPVIELFEKEVANYCGVKYAVAVSNGTAALHIAYVSAGLGPGDRLWTSPNTFVSSVNCALYCDAQVDFVDIDPKTYNLCVDKLEKKLKKAKNKDQLPKIVVPVHFAGQSCDMERISLLSQQYGFTVVEDACHSIGGSYQGKKIGSCLFSDMAVFSFHAVKIITSGEGGMVLTNSKELFNKLVKLRSHGITRNPEEMVGVSDGPWYYQQVELGWNYRITDLQAALGLSQLKRLNKFIKKRRQLAIVYDDKLSALSIKLPWQAPESNSSYHLYVIRLKLDKIKKNRREIFEKLRSAGIGVHVHYIPVHTQPFFQKLGFKQGDFVEAEKYYQEAITLPLFYDLQPKEQNYIINSLKSLVRN